MPKRRSKPRGKPSARRKRRYRRINIPLIWIIVAAVVVLILASLFIQSSNQISAASAHEKYQAGAFFLDVRTQEEFNQAHIHGSTLIPLDELSLRMNELPRSADIVVVCGTGRRSLEGMNILKQAGFNRVSCLTGGLEAWIAAGYPVESAGP